MNDAWFADHLTRSQFLRRYPAFAGLVAELEPMATDQVQIMAIARHHRADGRPSLRLYVNRDWLAAHPEQFAGVLQHELHHVVAGHVDDAALHRVAEPRIMELAMETVANENIVEPAPAGFVWQGFRELGLTAGQSTRERYHLLAAAHRDGRLQLLTEDELDRRFPGWRKLTKPHGNGGTRVLVWPKSGILPSSRRPSVLDADWHDEHRPGRRTRGQARGLGDALDRHQDGSRPGTWGKATWMLGYPTNLAQLQKWQLRIRAHLRDQRGGADDAVRDGLRAAKEMPRTATRAPGGGLAWANVLQRLLPSLRATTPDYRRPNRRFPARLGELPGRVRRARRPSLLVGVDTSASIDEATLGRMARELDRLAHVADVTIAECDAAVHRVHRNPRLEVVTGGGDTDFAAVFDLLGERADFDAVIYFTDGVGAWPDLRPSRPTLWVLTDDRAFDCPWGTVVRLTDAVSD